MEKSFRVNIAYRVSATTIALFKKIITQRHAGSHNDNSASLKLCIHSGNEADHIGLRKRENKQQKHVVRENSTNPTAEDRNLCHNTHRQTDPQQPVVVDLEVEEPFRVVADEAHSHR